ncbi:hypothetical protein AS159_06105 [Thermotoga sp. Ku-13t]|uniref:hypothetical protein n=1 Tax=Thermotoga sp. Ku-13t TaxID=1755813 RepID=UPI0013EA7276|nr:hypothetical protein [Thermotoga sp. Ku-13t]KAF2957958.1 hypothetical protein AS159_06105 [Thermotoga sp. Ku-13t]
MRRFVLCLMLVFVSTLFAEVFANFDSFLGAGVSNDLVVEGQRKQIDVLTNYGLQFGLDYGLHRGLRLGAIFSSQSFSVRFEGEILNFGLLCAGFEGLFAMGFLDIVLQVSGEAHWVISSFSCQDGQLSRASYTGNLFAGKAVFEKFLSENLSVAVGGGLKYFSVRELDSIGLKGFVPFALLRIGYSF